jgi:alkylation response protein AidB-like acyl-CoA dehydrogenase
MIVGAGDGPHVVEHPNTLQSESSTSVSVLEVHMNLELTPEQELIRASARELCARELVPHARAWDEAEELPRSLVGTLAEAGFLAAGLPEELGGGGLDSVSYCLLCEELGKADSSVRGIVSVSNGLYGKTVAKWGTEEQRARHLPVLASGEELGCYALTEPGCGSDAAALVTRAERDGAEWVLSGSKVFITLGSWAATAIVFARTGGPGPKGISAFLVPTGSDGFHARPLKGKLGLRAQDTAELSLDGVRVPGSALLGAEGEGFKVAMSALDNGRISLAAGCVGIAQGCLDAAVAYAKEREAFQRPVARFQLVQQLLAETHVETEAARLLTWRAAALADAGRPYTVEAAAAKWYASEAAVRAANAAVQVLGGYGYVDEYPVAKYLRDARVTTLYEGTSQIQTLIVGRALTGENAFN